MKKSLLFLFILFSSVSLQFANATQPKANAGDDKTICKGSSVQLSDNTVPGCTYLWTPITGLSSNVVSNPICATQITTQYILKVTN